MGDSIEGGRYRVGDKFVDANGKELKGSTAATESTAPGVGAGSDSEADASETYPHKELLAAGGMMDSDAVRTANYDELIAIDGIGPAKAREIMDHFGNG